MRGNPLNLVRFCLIGAGRAGLVHGANLRSRIRGAELVALCDSDDATLHRVGRDLEIDTLVTDYRDAVGREGIDAVVIVTPTFLHCRIACAAAESGKHIFLEKPMAITVDECRRINAAVEKAGVKLQIGFMRRFDERFVEAKEILDSGEMGRVMIIKSTGRGPGGPGPWMYNLQRSNGIIAEVNSHDIDTLNWFTGSQLRRVYAESHNFKCPDAKKDYPDFYDNFVANFRFADDTLGVIDGTCPAHYGYDARVEILCENGALFVGSVAQSGVRKVTLDGTAARRAVKSWRNLFKDAYLAEMEHFVECVTRHEHPRVTGMDGLKAVAAVVAANKSMRLCGPVEVEPC
jgi:myo-inositol 2-dehydrogenase/D-chiro-inositol 1-dehydrogenase/scyllo-inositol 2-dehydrogenase (NAD+)